MFDFGKTTQIYEDSFDSSWIHDIDGFKIVLNLDWKSIAVNLSGGADSALGTLLLAKIIKDNNSDCKIHVISHVRNWKTRPWAEHISFDVYNKLKELYPDIISKRHGAFIPSEIEESTIGIIEKINMTGDSAVVSSYNDYIIFKENIDAVYNFTTKNPEELIHPKKPPSREKDFLDKCTSNFYKNFIRENSWSFLPFMFVEKDFVIYQYFKNSWEDILNTTRSCEIDSIHYPEIGNLNYSSYIHGVSFLPTCLNTNINSDPCFWCAERKWAIEKVKKKFNYE